MTFTFSIGISSVLLSQFASYFWSEADLNPKSSNEISSLSLSLIVSSLSSCESSSLNWFYRFKDCGVSLDL